MMTSSRNGNGHKVIPDLPIEQKESYRIAGKWPPPAGLVILTEEKPPTDAVRRLLTALAKIVKPSQRKYVEQAEEKLSSKE